MAKKLKIHKAKDLMREDALSEKSMDKHLKIKRSKDIVPRAKRISDLDDAEYKKTTGDLEKKRKAIMGEDSVESPKGTSGSEAKELLERERLKSTIKRYKILKKAK